MPKGNRPSYRLSRTSSTSVSPPFRRPEIRAALAEAVEPRLLFAHRAGGDVGPTAADYITLNTSTKRVTIRGLPGTPNSDDIIRTWTDVDNIFAASIDIGADTYPAFKMNFAVSAVTSFDIDSGDGKDQLILDAGINTSLQAGTGNDTLRLARLAPASILKGSLGDGDDEFWYGSITPGVVGTLDNLDGVPSLYGGNGDDVLHIDDRAAGVGFTYTMNDTNIGRPGARTLQYYGVAERTEFLASDIASTFAVQGARTNLALVGGAGDDTFFLAKSTGNQVPDFFLGQLALDGAAGHDRVSIVDTGHTFSTGTYNLANDSFANRHVTFAGLDEGVLLTAPTSSDTITLSPSSTIAWTINDPTVTAAKLDTLLLGGGATNPAHVATGAAAGRWTFGDRRPIEYGSMSAVQSSLLVTAQATLTDTLPIRLSYAFADVLSAAPAKTSLQVRNGSGVLWPVESVAWDTTSRTAIFTLTGTAAPADGIYTATLSAANIHAGIVALPASRIDTFSILGGDSNGDRTVDFADLVNLAQHYGSSGRTFGEGNFDYSSDGSVDFVDLVILAQHYGQTLIAPTILFAGNATAGRASLDDDGGKRRRFGVER